MSFGYLGRHVAKLSLWTCIFFSLVFGSGTVCAESVAVIYPEVREAYKKVFNNITEGVEAELKQNILLREINKNTSPSETRAWLSKNSISAVVALGNKSIQAIGPDLDIPTVIGAVVFQPDTNQYAGISLSPSPEQLFSGLRVLLPTLKTIHVVYDPARNQWEVEAAAELAVSLGITVKPYPSEDLRTAAKAYRDIQSKMDSESEALWLPLGGPARDKAILQNILETAWVKEHAVISSNLADVKRGVLFAMYPDNVGMGENLGRLLKEVVNQTQSEPKIYFTTALFKAINRRTAEHLNIRIGQSDLDEYNFIYPPR